MEPKLDVGATINRIFSIYGSQAGVLLPLAFAIYLIVAVIGALLGQSLVLYPIVIAIGALAATLYQGMVVELVGDVEGGREGTTVSDLVDAVMPVVLPLIGAGILAGLAIGFGFLLLVVPGLILMTIWAVIAPAIVLEHCGVFEAFGRSRELVRGHGMQVFWVIVVVFLIGFAASVVLGAIAAGISDATLMRALFNLVASTLTAPLTALAAAVIYFALLGIKGEPAVADPQYAVPGGGSVSPPPQPGEGFMPPPPPPPPSA